MKKVFSTLGLLFVLTTSAYAEHEKNTYNSQKPVTCMTPQQMLGIVSGKFNEIPYIQGDGLAAATDGIQFINTQVIVSINPKTRTFSVVEIINPQLACVIAGGENVRIVIKPSEKTKVSLEK
tara:strand:- start:627 stop:992 length:366 start_codon:yes stop_codon:yes gene_type:complete